MTNNALVTITMPTMVGQACTSLKNSIPDAVVSGTMLNINMADTLADACLNPNDINSCPTKPKLHISSNKPMVGRSSAGKCGRAGPNITNADAA